ncbi:MAG: MFS transporter [Desmonostoc geniculatum HA4340-LM1]|nr:MFS transporter [Desmonostoc geniculatum HA4340-LM1]
MDAVCLPDIGRDHGSKLSAGNGLFSDITTKENRAKVMALVGAAFALGLCLGPAISSMLVGSDSQNPNLILPPLFSAGMSLFGFTIALFGLPEPIKAQARTQELPHRFAQAKLVEILNTSPTGILLLLSFLTTFVMLGVMAIIAIWSNQKFGWGPQEIAYFYIFSGIMGAIVQVKLVEPLTKRFGEANSLFGGLVVMGFAVFLIPLSKNLLLVLAAVSLTHSGYFICKPLLTSLLSQSAGAKQQGQVLGIAESFLMLGKILGPLTTGFLFASLGYDWPFWIGTIVMVIASIFGWLMATASKLSSSVSKQRQRKMKKLFDLLDHNKNKVIEPIDFEQGFQAIADIRGWTPDSPDYWIVHSFWVGLQRKIQSLMDTDGDGRITMNEWLKYMNSRLDHDFADSFTELQQFSGN